MRKIFFAIICLVVGATWFALAPAVLAKEKTVLYEDVNVSFTYPG